MKKLAVVCNAAIPTIAGSTILLNNLLSEYPGEVHMISSFDKVGDEDPHLRPPYPVHRFTTPSSLLNRLLSRYNTKLRPLFVRFLARKFKALDVDAVMATYPTGYILDCVYEACKIAGVKYWVHMHDLWEENTREGTFEYDLAKSREAFLLKNADKVFCMTDVQADFYTKKYGITPHILPHVIPSDKVNKAISKASDTDKSEFHILYSGSVSSHMNLDALKTFIQAVNQLPSNYSVTMLVKYETEYLKTLGIYSDRINYKWVSTEEAFEIQKNSDILFLPLSFKNCSIHEVDTVFATKALDYLASGTPILVFSPPSCFHNKSASKNNWGYIIDQDDATQLSDGIIKLCNDRTLQQKTLQGAKLEMRERIAKVHADYLYDQLHTS